MDNLESIVRRIYLLREQAKACTDEARDLANSLDLEIGSHAAGQFVVQVQAVKRFDAATAKKALGDDLYRGICTLQPDTKVAKKLLTGYEYEECQKVTGTKVLIKEVTDED